MSAKRVLLAEDNRELANIVRFNLEAHGFGVSVAHDGRRAQAHAEVMPFDAAIIDYKIPLADGVEVVRAIRASKINADIPVVMYTANASELHVVRLIEELQLLAVVAKPFSPVELVGLLTERIGRVEAV